MHPFGARRWRKDYSIAAYFPDRLSLDRIDKFQEQSHTTRCSCNCTREQNWDIEYNPEYTLVVGNPGMDHPVLLGCNGSLRDTCSPLGEGDMVGADR